MFTLAWTKDALESAPNHRQQVTPSLLGAVGRTLLISVSVTDARTRCEAHAIQQTSKTLVRVIRSTTSNMLIGGPCHRQHSSAWAPNSWNLTKEPPNHASMPPTTLPLRCWEVGAGRQHVLSNVTGWHLHSLFRFTAPAPATASKTTTRNDLLQSTNRDGGTYGIGQNLAPTSLLDDRRP